MRLCKDQNAQSKILGRGVVYMGSFMEICFKLQKTVELIGILKTREIFEW